MTHGDQVSALREAALAREIHDAGISTMNSLYMGGLTGRFLFCLGPTFIGFYVYSCPKMRYKGDYKPSYLLDPVGNTISSSSDTY